MRDQLRARYWSPFYKGDVDRINLAKKAIKRHIAHNKREIEILEELVEELK